MKSSPISSNVEFEGVVTLQSSLSHIAETIGTDALLRREKIIQPDNRVEEVFVYSGNAFRGQLRDCGMLYFIERLGLKGFNLDTFYFLFSGGTLQKTGVRGIDVDLIRKMRKLVPFSAILGGAWGNNIMPGKLVMGKMYPLCQECQRQIPDKYHDRLAESWRPWIQEESYTKTDDAKNVHLRPLIQADQPNMLPGADKPKKPAETRPVQMRHTVETIAAGAQFYHSMRLYGVSQIEYGAFLSALSKFSERPFLGGMSRAGHGQCVMEYNHCTIGPVVSMDEEARQAKAAYDDFLKEYDQFMLDHSEEVRDVLGLSPAEDNGSPDE